MGRGQEPYIKTSDRLLKGFLDAYFIHRPNSPPHHNTGWGLILAPRRLKISRQIAIVSFYSLSAVCQLAYYIIINMKCQEEYTAIYTKYSNPLISCNK